MSWRNLSHDGGRKEEVKQKKILFLSCVWRVYGSDRFLELLKSQDPEELFVSQGHVFEEGTCIKADCLLYGKTIQVVW